MKKILTSIVIALVSLLVFWAPFLLKIDNFWGIEFGKSGMETIVQNFDGLNFIVVAKSWYQPDKIELINQAFLTGNEPVYFSAHYPLLAGIVSVFDLVTTGPNAVLLTIILSNVFLAYGLYVFFSEFVGKKSSFWLTMVALFLPARMLAVRGVLSTETLFIPLTLLALVAARRNKYWYSAILGSLAVLTRSPGIILFGSIGLAWMIQRKKVVRDLMPYLLIPFTLVCLWIFYGYAYGSMFAYFNSGDNLHLFFPPFRVFGNNESWITGMWREEIIYIYLLFTAGVVSWGKNIWKENNMASMISVFYPALLMFTILFVSHRDIARYSLPLSPFVIAGFAASLEQRWIKWIVIVMLVPIYLYCWQFVLDNIQPVSDWSVLL